MHHTWMGFDPLFAEGAEFTEWKTDAFTNQATTAGLYGNLYTKIFKCNCILQKIYLTEAHKPHFQNWMLTSTV